MAAVTLGNMDVVGVRPGVSLVGMLAQAYRRTVRDGHGVVSSALVLRYGVARVSELGQFPPPWSRAWRQKLEPVDDDPPAGCSGLFPAFDRQVRLLAEGALRQAAHDGGPGAAVFSPLVCHAVYEAVHEASRRDGVPAGVRHLLAAVLAEPGSAAARLTEQMWIVGHGGPLLDRQSARYRAGGRPPDWAPHILKALRVLPPTTPRAWHLPWTVAVTADLYVTVRRPFRRHGARYGHPIPVLIESNAALQAVRLARATTGTVEILLSILDLHEQLDTAAAVLPEPVARYNTAGDILRAHNVTLLAATTAAAQSPPLPATVVDPMTIPTIGWPTPPASKTRRPPLDPAATLALRSASSTARQAGDPFTGTSHLLAGILDDHDGPAAQLLRALHTDPDLIAAQACARQR